MSSEFALSPEAYFAILYGNRNYMERVTPDSPSSQKRVSSKDRRLRDILDALAAVCVAEAQQHIAVSMSLTPSGVTLYVSGTGASPHLAANHLLTLRTLLKAFKTSLVAGEKSMTCQQAAAKLEITIYC